MQKITQNNKSSVADILVTIGLYISYCLAYFYLTRGSIAFMDTTFYIFLANDIVAFLVGGTLPFVIFLLASGVISKNLFRFPSLNIKKALFSLKIFLICANVVCFFSSLSYYAFRPLFVWGNILFNFVITSAFVIGYLFYYVKKITDKSKIGIFITSVGTCFLFIYLGLAVINLVLGVI